jgi:hypothetical protein
MGGMRSAHKTLVGNHKRKIPHGRLRRTWEDNIKIILKEIRFEDVNRLHIVEYSPVVGFCEHCDEPLVP